MSIGIQTVAYGGESIPCAVCAHPDRNEIEIHIKNGEAQDWIGARFGLAPLALLRPDGNGGFQQIGPPTSGERVRLHRQHDAP